MDEDFRTLNQFYIFYDRFVGVFVVEEGIQSVFNNNSTLTDVMVMITVSM